MQGKLLSWMVAIALSLGCLTACQTTHQVSESPKEFSGFLGDYSKLQKGSGNEANYIYIDKSAKWASYTKLYIKSIELWKVDSPDSAFAKMSREDQQNLVNYLHTALVDNLNKDFQIVDQPGPNTIVIHAAITEGKGSKPALNLISTVLPVGLVISYAKQAITGTGTAVGVAMIEADFTDGQSGQRIAAVVDARAGTKALRSKFDGTWGDLKLAFDWWAQRLDARFELLKRGNFSADSL
jgi:hypothetical protein